MRRGKQPSARANVSEVRFSSTDLNLAEAVHHADLDVLCSGLDDLEERLDGKLDGLIPCEIVPVVLLEELADRL